SVGLYPTSAPAQVRQILDDCGARVLVVDDAAQLAKAAEVRGELPGLRTIVSVTGGCESIHWDAWMERGSTALASAKVAAGLEAALVVDHTRVWQAAEAYGPTLFGGLPRFYEKAYEALHAEHLRADGAARAAWDRTVELGVERSKRMQARRPVPRALEEEW